MSLHFTPPPSGGGVLSRRCAGCRRMIGVDAPEPMVMVVHERRVRWLHEQCAQHAWGRMMAANLAALASSS